MSVEEAVAVLNRVRHRGHSGWYLAGDGPFRTVLGEDYYEFFTPFEAVAVASKYRANPLAGPGERSEDGCVPHLHSREGTDGEEEAGA